MREPGFEHQPSRGWAPWWLALLASAACTHHLSFTPFDGGVATGGGGAPDGGAPADGGVDAGAQRSEATCVGFHPTHDYTQPVDQIASPLAPIWSTQLTDPTGEDTYSVPAISRGILLLAIDSFNQPGHLQGLDLDTGAKLWGPIASSGLLTVENGRIFAVEPNQQIADPASLAAYDLETGAGPIWQTVIPVNVGIFVPPVAAGGLVYLNSYGVTYAFNEETGELQWQAGEEASDAPVSAVDGVVYQAAACGALTAFAAATGAKLWSQPGPCFGGSTAETALYEDLIFFNDGGVHYLFDSSGHPLADFAWIAPGAFHNGAMVCRKDTYEQSLVSVDVHSHQTNWELDDAAELGGPVIAGGGGQVFVVSASGALYELDEQTGAKISSFNFCSSQTPCSSSALLLAGNHLVLNTFYSVLVF